MAEDCLFANVWRPTRAFNVTGSGGGAEGAGDDGLCRHGLDTWRWVPPGRVVGGWYDGAALAGAGDVIVVSFNYRLGRSASCRCRRRGAGGMNGIRDQVMALRWVQRHAGAFGGDPERVTIFGESAGGVSVCLLCVSPWPRACSRTPSCSPARARCRPATRRSRRVGPGQRAPARDAAAHAQP